MALMEREMADFGSKTAGELGGKAAAKKLSAEERTERARRAAEAKWEKLGIPPPLKATHTGVLALGESEIDCYVLEDKSRVISTRGMMKALGRRWRGRKHSGTELPVFVEAKNLSAFIDNDLRSVLSPVYFRTDQGAKAEGLRAEVLPKVCEIYLQARDAGELKGSQLGVAKQAEILMRGLAHVGIVALVDEATGYQRDRARYDLAEILEKFVAKEIQKWLRTFPLEFYELICKVRGEPIERAYRRPSYFGHLTNNIVYERLAPGVLQELRRKNPVQEGSGRRKHVHTQFLTPDMGHPKLREHLEGVITALKIARLTKAGWDGFIGMLDETHPKFRPLPLFDKLDVDSD